MTYPHSKPFISTNNSFDDCKKCMYHVNFIECHTFSSNMNEAGFEPWAAGGRRRKSPQWFGLRREAAELVARDYEFLPVMRQYCVAHRMVDGRCARGLGALE